MPEIDVTVVVPCYNTANYLDQCLASIEKNTMAALEILVINDGSTDDSLAIMRSHEQLDSRVRVIDKPNQGYGATVNRGFDEARGTYVAIVEPDDYLDPGMYDALFSLARKKGFPDIVKSSYWRLVMSGTPKERRLHCWYYKRIKPKTQPFTLLQAPRLIQYHPSIWSALYRRDFLEAHSIRLHEEPGAGWVDNPFLMDTMLSARTIVYTDKAFYCYREDLASASSAKRTTVLSLTRWNDMADIVDAHQVADFEILHAFYVVGFNYVAHAVSAGALKNEDELKLIKRVFERMDPAVVEKMDDISPERLELYSQLTARPLPSVSKASYLRARAADFIYAVRTNGIGFACSLIGVYFSRFEQGE